MVVPAEIRRALAEHARAEAPNEACGLIAFRGEVAERYIPATNAAESPYRFELEPRDPLDFFLEDEGYELAVFPLPSLRLGEALSHGRRKRRPVARPPVPDPLARTRRAPSLAHPRRTGRGGGALCLASCSSAPAITLLSRPHLPGGPKRSVSSPRRASP